MIKELFVVPAGVELTAESREARRARANLTVDRFVFVEPGHNATDEAHELADDFRCIDILETDSSPELWLPTMQFVNPGQASAYYIAMTAWAKRRARGHAAQKPAESPLLKPSDDEQRVVLSPSFVVDAFLKHHPTGQDETALTIDRAKPPATFRLEVLQ